MFHPADVTATTDNPPTPTGPRPSSIRTRFPQFAAALIVSLLHFTCYIAVDMYRKHSPWLEEKIKMEVVTYIVSALSYVIFAILIGLLNRKMCAYIIGVGYITTGVLQQFAESSVVYYAAHAFREFSKAGTTMFFVIYITEIAQNDIRGALLLVSPMVQNGTYAIVVLLELFIDNFSLSWFVIVPPVITTLCFRFWLPESPVYYLRRGNRDAAARSLQWLRGKVNAEDVARELEGIDDVLKATRSDSQAHTNVLQELFTRRALAYCGIVFALAAAEPFTGWDRVFWTFVYSPTNNELIVSLMVVMYVLPITFAIFVCDRKGRKSLLLSSLLICTISLIAIAICFHVPETRYDGNLSISEVFTLVFCFIFLFGFTIGLTFLLPVVVADIFSSKLLTSVLATKEIISATLRLFPNYIFRKRFTKPTPGDFWIPCAVCVASAFIVWMFLPETKKRPAGILFMDHRDHIVAWGYLPIRQTLG